MSKIQITIEFELNEENIASKGFDHNDMLDNILLNDNKVAGCFEIIENFSAYRNAYNLFIDNGKIIDKKLIIA